MNFFLLSQAKKKRKINKHCYEMANEFCNWNLLIHLCILESLLSLAKISRLYSLISQVKCDLAGKRKKKMLRKKRYYERHMIRSRNRSFCTITCFWFNSVTRFSLTPNAAWYVVRSACRQINSTRTLFFMQITNSTGSEARCLVSISAGKLCVC